MSDSSNFINLGKCLPKGKLYKGDFLIPSEFSDDYDINDPVYLGSGAFGTVFALEGVKDGHIAVKRFNAPFEEKYPKKAQHCLRELYILRDLKHDNIVRMKSAYSPDECLKDFSRIYLVTEYCGANFCGLLERETQKSHKYNLRSFQSMIYDLLKAIKFLNSANIIHRDLKPDNFAINKDGKLTLLDFGYARVKKSEMTNEPGQRFYRAFETFSLKNNEKPVYTERVDIWSIGAILYEMLTGQILFFDKDERRRIHRIIEVGGPIPEDVLKEIEDTQIRDHLRKMSRFLDGSEEKKRTRMNFIKQLEKHSRPWLKKEMEIHVETAANFIDRALDYDHRTRMSVDEALRHPFLAQVRQPEKEVTTAQFIPDYGDLALEESKDLIWRLIHQVGPPRSLRPRKVAAQIDDQENRKRLCEPVQS